MKADFVLPEEPLAELTFFCLDIETTSNSKKQYDRIIELAIVAYNHRGVELGRLDQRFSNQGVPISPHAFDTHHISAEDLSDFYVLGSNWIERLASMCPLTGSEEGGEAISMCPHINTPVRILTPPQKKYQFVALDETIFVV